MALTVVSDTLPIFPTDLSFGRPGGPEYLTDVVVLESGHEQRNSYWSEPRYSWDVGYGVRSHDKIYALLKFFHACKGRLRPFRIKDWEDFKSCAIHLTPAPTDQSLGVAIAAQTQFQLKKTYPESPYTTAINIIKPNGPTIRVAVDGVEETSGWTVNETTGVITRSAGLTGGEAITWGGEFYRKARFESDVFPSVPEFKKGGTVQIMVVHVR